MMTQDTTAATPVTGTSSSSAPGAHMRAELLSQPETWERAIAQEHDDEAARGPLLPRGARVAVVGCGTSWFMAQAFAAARENAGLGVTDVFPASEAPVESFGERGIDYVVVITRSGTTTEVLELLDAVQAQREGTKPHTIAVIGDVNTPIVGKADQIIALPYADEQSVVQTRFASTALVYLLTSLGLDVSTAIQDARDALAQDVPQELLDAEQFTFLGHDWTYGLANEAALKMREAVQGWTEAYPVKEYRHGPISIAAPNRVTWLFGADEAGIAADVQPTGAHMHVTDIHPLADLAFIHKVALERALGKGLDPDSPRNLTRSVILDEEEA